MGITFIGGAWDEAKLIGFAYDFEQATKVRRPPQYVPTIGDALFPGAPSSLTFAPAERKQVVRGLRGPIVRFR